MIVWQSTGSVRLLAGPEPRAQSPGSRATSPESRVLAHSKESPRRLFRGFPLHPTSRTLNKGSFAAVILDIRHGSARRRIAGHAAGGRHDVDLPRGHGVVGSARLGAGS